MLGESSLVPCPNALSALPLARSKPAFSPATFSQSVVPYVVGLAFRLPSPAAKLLPDSGAEQLAVEPFGAKSQPDALSAPTTGAQTATAPRQSTTAASARQCRAPEPPRIPAPLPIRPCRATDRTTSH